MSEVEFRNPPLAEVSFGVRYRTPPEFSTAYIGRFWAQIAAEFSQALDRPPILDQHAVSGPTVGFEGAFAPRVWLVHKDQALLLQIQRDRFYVNWRRLGDTPNGYPSFANLKPSFMKYLGEWRSFMDASGLGQLEIHGCELTYTNFISPDSRWNGLTEIGKVFEPLRASQDINATRILSGWNGTYDFEKNRVTATIQTFRNVTDNSQHRIQFDVKAEPLLPSDAASDFEAWMIAANSNIVSAFLSLTTEWARKDLWERIK
jgi:uncharacterized protein (TIGR04255 family)